MEADLAAPDVLHPVTRDAVVVAATGGDLPPRRPGRYWALLDRYRGRDAPGRSEEVEPARFRGGSRRLIPRWGSKNVLVGGLAGSGIRRRASILDSVNKSVTGPTTAVLRGPPGNGSSTPTAPSSVPANLQLFGARHGCGSSIPIAYLSDDRLSPALRGFQVLEQLAFDERRLRPGAVSAGCRAAEILVRGVAIDPGALRRRLRLRGSRPLAVVITRIGAGSLEPCDRLCVGRPGSGTGRLAASLNCANAFGLRGRLDDALSVRPQCSLLHPYGPGGLAGGWCAAVMRRHKALAQASQICRASGP